MSILYAGLSDYITARAKDFGYSASALSEKLGFGRSYISSVIHGQFTPSQERCWKIAEFFGDDPNIILGLAGYYKPPRETELTTTLTSVADDLPHRLKRTLLEYAMFLKTRQTSPAGRESRAHYDLDTLYIELPSGEGIELELPPDVAAKILELPLGEIGDVVIAAFRALD